MRLTGDGRRIIINIAAQDCTVSLDGSPIHQLITIIDRSCAVPFNRSDRSAAGRSIPISFLRFYEIPILLPYISSARSDPLLQGTAPFSGAISQPHSL